MWGLGDVFALDGFATGPLQVSQPAAVQTAQAGYPVYGLPGPPGGSPSSAGAPGYPAYPGAVSASGYPSQGYRFGPRGSAAFRYGGQFAQPGPPQGFHDEDFVHIFNAVTTPVLGSLLLPGASLRDVPLILETDAEFVLQGIDIFDGTNIPDNSNLFLTFQIKEPGGKFLMPETAAVVLAQAFLPGGLSLNPTGPMSVMTVPVEPELLCPAGGVFLLYVTNTVSFLPGVALNTSVSFYGVKRRSNACK